MSLSTLPAGFVKRPDPRVEAGVQAIAAVLARHGIALGQYSSHEDLARQYATLVLADSRGPATAMLCEAVIAHLERQGVPELERGPAGLRVTLDMLGAWHAATGDL
jgi:hypothetical protein